MVQSVFEDAFNYMKTGTLMRQVVNKPNEIDFNRAVDRHTCNDIYEKILKHLQSAGNAGELYTPRVVTQFKDITAHHSAPGLRRLVEVAGRATRETAPSLRPVFSKTPPINLATRWLIGISL